ncbi:hypothetical protein P5673_033731, partial [Acropora cervicornis]
MELRTQCSANYVQQAGAGLEPRKTKLTGSPLMIPVYMTQRKRAELDMCSSERKVCSSRDLR